MATLRDIKQRITAVRNTAKITQAMRMVAAAKLRRAQESIESARPYVLKLSDILKNLVDAVGEEYTHPLIQPHKKVASVAVVVIASDRGFCGSFNTNIFRKAEQYMTNELPKEHPGAECSLIMVGKKTCNYFSNTKFNVISRYPQAFAPLDYSTATEIVETLTNLYFEEKIDKVVVFFNEFKNILQQVQKSITLLPIENEVKPEVESKFNTDYIFEPNQKEILDVLLPKYIDIQMWRTLLESNAAEQAARMVAMENATNNANDLISHLELVYNKERQASITKELLEIVGGAEALGK